MQKKCFACERNACLVVHNPTAYFIWTETIESLRLYKHKIEHDTHVLSRTSVLFRLSSHVSFPPWCPPGCLLAEFVSPRKKKKSTYQTSAHHWPIDTFSHPDCVKVDGFDYMNLQGNVLTKIAEDCGYTDILRLPWQTVRFKINDMCLTFCSSSWVPCDGGASRTRL